MDSISSDFRYELRFSLIIGFQMLTSAQCRAARALLDWSQQKLADASRVGNATIRNFESSKTAPQNATLEVLQRAFEDAGVIFIDENGEGPGVRLRKNIAAE